MRFRLTERAYLAERIVEEGEEIGDGTSVPFSGAPGPHMVPLDKEAEKAMAAYTMANPNATLDPFQRGGTGWGE